MAEQQTLSVQQALELANQHHSAGRLPEAEQIYQQVLLQEPDQPHAIHMLGVLAHQVGKHELAVELITRTLVIQPDLAEAHCNLGVSLQHLGRLTEAYAKYQEAIKLKPTYRQFTRQ